VGNLFFEFAAYGGESEMKIVGTPHAPARDFVPCTPEMRVYEALSYAPLFFSGSQVALFLAWPGCASMVFGGIRCWAARLLSLYCLIT